jgi:excisionase family DNA binding protein
MVESDVLNSEDAASLLRLHVKTVLRLARQGKIPGCKVGGEWRFTRSELLDWLWVDEELKRPANLVLTRAEILFAGEVALMFKLHEKTVEHHARQGEIPGCKVGNQWLFLRTALQVRLKQATQSDLVQPLAEAS